MPWVHIPCTTGLVINSKRKWLTVVAYQAIIIPVADNCVLEITWQCELARNLDGERHHRSPLLASLHLLVFFSRPPSNISLPFHRYCIILFPSFNFIDLTCLFHLEDIPRDTFHSPQWRPLVSGHIPQPRLPKLSFSSLPFTGICSRYSIIRQVLRFGKPVLKIKGSLNQF